MHYEVLTKDKNSNYSNMKYQNVQELAQAIKANPPKNYEDQMVYVIHFTALTGLNEVKETLRDNLCGNADPTEEQIEEIYSL